MTAVRRREISAAAVDGVEKRPRDRASQRVHVRGKARRSGTIYL